MSADVRAAAIDEDTVRAIVEQVWESLLQAPAVPFTGTFDRAAATAVTAEVALTGDWNGLVRLGCDAGTARDLARVMLAAEPDEELGADDVEDAVGEVVNVVGGNVKGTLPGTTALGLPRVAQAAGRHDQQDGVAPVTRCVVDWAGSPVLVEVVTVPVH